MAREESREESGRYLGANQVNQVTAVASLGSQVAVAVSQGSLEVLQSGRQVAAASQGSLVAGEGSLER